jgi:hypothetical protein
VFLVLATTAAGVGLLLREPPPDLRPHPFNRERNAVWLEHRWLAEPQPREDVENLLVDLSRRGVHYLFPHLIPFDRSGRLPPHSRDQLRAFLAAARARAPQIKVLPWVGGLRVGYQRTLRGTIDLGDLSQRQQILAECRGLIDEGFDGIHLNVEPVANGDDAFLSLLRALRPAVGDDGLISVSVTRPSPIGLPLAPRFAWTPDYYRRVATAADQIVVMGYDTGIPSAALYRRYMAYAARSSTQALAPLARARVLIGVPTYDARGLMHREGVETFENALLGVIAGLRGTGAGGTFEGVAVYAGWTTDATEWAIYERLWRGGAEPPH